MAETAKVLNPDRIVVVPDREAGCSLVDSCPVEPVREFRRRNPDYAIVSYINTSIEVKAESDILCTSRNAVKVVNSIPREQPVLFLPDLNLGNYVKRADRPREMKIWQGACIVHATFPARRLAEAQLEHPEAQVAAHPGMPAKRCWRMADFIGSTSAIMEWCAASEATEFIVMTESGIRYSLERLAPAKTLLFRGQRELQLQRVPVHEAQHSGKAARCLRHLAPRVELSDELMARALAHRADAGREVNGHDATHRYIRPRSRQPAAERHGPLQYPLLLLHAGRRTCRFAAAKRFWVSRRSSASCASPCRWA